MPIFTDLHEIKSVLQIDPEDLSEDKTLGFYIEWVSSWFEEILNRDFVYKTRTQYYRGSGTQKLLLRNRPVYPAPTNPLYLPIQVTYDSSGYYGSAPGAFTNAGGTSSAYTYGVNYCLQIDQDDGSSRSGILLRIGDAWLKPTVRQAGLLSPFIGDDMGSYQVIYTAGYTVETLPGIVRAAANELVAKLRFHFPLGFDTSGDSYEEKSVSILNDARNYLITPTLKSMLWSSFRNWKW